VALGALFDGRSQLVVYHFMFGPEWEEECPACSLLSDLQEVENGDGMGERSSSAAHAAVGSSVLRSPIRAKKDQRLSSSQNSAFDQPLSKVRDSVPSCVAEILCSWAMTKLLGLGLSS
jgi:predicted dithiol-disulfide oxidoreductase (DUF899 family)